MEWAKRGGATTRRLGRLEERASGASLLRALGKGRGFISCLDILPGALLECPQSLSPLPGRASTPQLWLPSPANGVGHETP